MAHISAFDFEWRHQEEVYRLTDNTLSLDLAND